LAPPPPTAVAVASRTEPQTWQVWTGLSIVYLVWGSTYLAIRVIVETLPPMLTGGMRFTIAGLVMLGMVVARRGIGAFRSLDRRQIGWSAFVGACLATGGNGLVMVGEQWIASGLAALIITAVPLWIVLFRRVSGERVSRVTLAGVLSGFAGVGLLLLPGGGGHTEPIGFAIIVGASLCWATGSFTSQRARVTLPSDPMLSTGLQMTAGGLLGITIGLSLGEAGQIKAGSFAADSVIAFVYLILIGSLLAYTTYSWLLQNVPISKVATYAFVNPVVAIFLGWLFLSEDVTLTIAIGAAIVVASVAAIIRQESAKPREEVG
jgi:drug/metabolite transporter (DMT)-like permease